MSLNLQLNQKHKQNNFCKKKNIYILFIIIIIIINNLKSSH